MTFAVTSSITTDHLMRFQVIFRAALPEHLHKVSLN